MANELAIVNYSIDALAMGVEAMNNLYEELGADAQPEFATAKTPSSGMTAWSIKAFKDDDDPEITKAIEGVIVHAHKTNAWWKDDLDQAGGQMPDCRSNDGVTGIDTEGVRHACADCPHNKFGSDGGRGKACKNSRVLYVLRQGDILPIKVTLAPTGNRPYDKYVESLIIPKKRGQKPMRPAHVITKISLKCETSAGGQKYSLPVFECVGMLDEDARLNIADYAAGLIRAAEQPVFTEVDPADTPFD